MGALRYIQQNPHQTHEISWERWIHFLYEELKSQQDSSHEYWYYTSDNHTKLHHPDYIRHWEFPLALYKDNAVEFYEINKCYELFVEYLKTF